MCIPEIQAKAVESPFGEDRAVYTVVLRLAYLAHEEGLGVWSLQSSEVPESAKKFTSLIFRILPASNVQAGYWTLIHALLELRSRYRKGEIRVKVRFPEPSLPNQLNGIWRVRSGYLRNLWEAVKELEKQFVEVEYTWAPADVMEEKARLKSWGFGEKKNVELSPEMREALRKKLPEILKVIRGMTFQAIYYAFNLILSSHQFRGMKVSRKELVKGEDLLSVAMNTAVEEDSRVEKQRKEVEYA